MTCFAYHYVVWNYEFSNYSIYYVKNKNKKNCKRVFINIMHCILILIIVNFKSNDIVYKCFDFVQQVRCMEFFFQDYNIEKIDIT